MEASQVIVECDSGRFGAILVDDEGDDGHLQLSSGPSVSLRNAPLRVPPRTRLGNCGADLFGGQRSSSR